MNYDIDQICKGIKVEFEHTDDPMIALKIALDHLKEIPDYYDKLEIVEKGVVSSVELDDVIDSVLDVVETEMKTKDL